MDIEKLVFLTSDYNDKSIDAFAYRFLPSAGLKRQRESERERRREESREKYNGQETKRADMRFGSLLVERQSVTQALAAAASRLPRRFSVLIKRLNINRSRKLLRNSSLASDRGKFRPRPVWRGPLGTLGQ